ncbi:MAG: hypothetical protein HPY55_03045 [Firmicutes bacterium]|nr:hypothetical protein [Bacillota bacterium]
MKALVTFYSRTGTTEQVAGLLADRLCSEGIEVTVAPIRTEKVPGVFSGILQARVSARPTLSQAVADTGGYDLVFIGFPVWAGRPAPAVNSFLSGLKSAAGQKFAPFATCGISGGHQAPLSQVSSHLTGIGCRVVTSRGFWRGNRSAFRQSVDEFAKQALKAAGKAQ